MELLRGDWAGALMPFHEFDCPEHETVTIKLPAGEATGDFRPCPVVLYEGDEDDAGEISPESVVLCGEESRHIFPTVHKMLLDRKTRRKHAYPTESGMDGPDRPSLRDPDFMAKVREKATDKANKKKGRRIYTGDLGKPLEPMNLLPIPGKGLNVP